MPLGKDPDRTDTSCTCEYIGKLGPCPDTSSEVVVAVGLERGLIRETCGTGRLLERRDPDAVAARRVHGDLPTVEEFARAIVIAANDPLSRVLLADQGTAQDLRAALEATARQARELDADGRAIAQNCSPPEGRSRSGSTSPSAWLPSTPSSFVFSSVGPTRRWPRSRHGPTLATSGWRPRRENDSSGCSPAQARDEAACGARYFAR
jgi:hypothetical protein